MAADQILYYDGEDIVTLDEVIDNFWNKGHPLSGKEIFIITQLRPTVHIEINNSYIERVQ